MIHFIDFVYTSWTLKQATYYINLNLMRFQCESVYIKDLILGFELRLCI